jgi:dTDP-4-dehydrorhamnose reductase
MGPTTEQELEDLLATPREADIETVRSLSGDILILGVGGKMGPSLAKLTQRAVKKAGSKARVVAVARFSRGELTAELESEGIQTIAMDLLQPGALESLPDGENVIFMAARKFGTTGAEHLTWAMNTFLPGRVAERFRNSRIVAFSTGNVYPLLPIAHGGATEETPVGPAGEYAQSALGRERLFEYAAAEWGTKVCLLRLNYAVDLRYGVLVDIGLAVRAQRPIDVSMGMVNVIWQGDANSMCLRSLRHCSSPANVLNITGPETLSVRQIAHEFGRRFGVSPVITGSEKDTALLNNAGKAHALFGYPSVTANQLLDWVAGWIEGGGAIHNKPTHFEARDGRF